MNPLIHFQEMLPHPLLSRYIKSFWYMMAPAHQHPSDYQLAADTYADLFVSLHTGRLFIEGLMTKPIPVAINQHTHILGIRFKPHAFMALMGIPLRELTDTRVEADLLSHPLLKEISSFCLNSNGTWQNAAAHIEQLLLKRATQQHYVDKRVIGAVTLLEQQKGWIPVAQLAQACCLSPRQLERTFQEVVGVSPKMYGRLLRFRSVCQTLTSADPASLTDIALQHGYYDLAHLTHDFQTLAGNTPSAFLPNTLSFFYKY